MFGIAKNITKNLAGSETLPNIALPTSRIVCTIRKYILHARIWAYSCCTSISYRRGLLAQERGASSFYTHTLTKFLTNKCQQASKICSRRKMRRVQTYSLRNRLLVPIAIFPARIFSRSRSSLKKPALSFVEFETLCTFVSANVAISNSIRYILNRIIAGFPRHYRTCCDIARLPKHKEPRFFCIHTLTNFCFSEWQTWTKVASPRTTVTGLHLCVRRSLKLLIAIFPARIFSKQCSLRNRRLMSSTSTARPSTASRCLYRGHTMRVTRSWRWVAPSSSSATGTSALLSTTSAYAKGLSNVINPTTL